MQGKQDAEDRLPVTRAVGTSLTIGLRSVK